MSLDYSLDGEINRIIFYSDFNDVNFFVEDKDKEYEYEAIFNRLFGDALKVTAIFSTSGKLNLKEAYNILKKESCKSINFFIADLDFDNILEYPMIQDEVFIYLNKYCIENYFMNKKAVIHFIQGRIKKREIEAAKIIKYDFWKNEITRQLYDLFILFLIAQDNNTRIENVGESPFAYIKDTSWEIDDNKVKSYYKKLKENVTDLDKKINEMKKKVTSKIGQDISSLISGKFYFASLKRYLLNFSQGIIVDVDLRNMLIRYFDINTLDFIKERVLEVKEKHSLAS